MRMEDEEAAAATTGTSEPSAKRQEPSLTAHSREEPPWVTSQTEAAGDTLALSAEATGDSGGLSEFVHDDEVPGMAELQERLQ